MNRIEKKFRALRAMKRKALIAFITAGDPSLQKTEQLVYALEKEGVDLIELGVPFSDPLADGPVIQAASNRSLAHHTTLPRILALTKKIRSHSQIPILLKIFKISPRERCGRTDRAGLAAGGRERAEKAHL
jgi:tryptophan synthase alpha chain